jgi:hypothetical protein
MSDRTFLYLKFKSAINYRQIKSSTVLLNFNDILLIHIESEIFIYLHIFMYKLSEFKKTNTLIFMPLAIQGWE